MGMPKLDLKGKTFGRWNVEAEVYPTGFVSKSIYWQCRCICGNTGDVRGTSLVQGESKSCGCLHRDLSSIRQKALNRGNPARKRGTLEYFKCNTWNNIRKRVVNGKPNPRNKSYIRKGIELRMSKEQFYNWCDTHKEKVLTMKKPSIDRLDSNGHYELANIQILEHSDNLAKRWRDGSSCYFTVDSSLNITNEHN